MISFVSAFMKRRLWFKFLLGAGFLLVLLAAMAWLFPQEVLTVDSGPVKADAMVVLGGFPDRAVCAAELFKQGEAPEILVSGFGDCILNEKLLENNGVTNAAIILEPKSRTTRQNAEFSIPLLRQLGAHRVIIVTSWYHSRRALACFEHYAPEIQFYSRPSYYGYVGEEQGAGNGAATSRPVLSPVEVERVRAARKAEWKRVRGYADTEYIKLLGYWVCYGVWPV
jgi:uncharacterized SAM-binding protein YcdF (DUF218 family)